MTLAGTRPPLIGEVSLYELHHRARLAIKPGITGMWQVSGRSDITDFEEVVRLDREYIENWSFGLDVKILVKTVLAVFMRDKKLVIAGGSSDTDEFAKELKELAKGDERILFTGFVQGQALEELYSNAYVYTLPSDLEGMPLSLLEAMSYGNCCLVSDIAECAEVVEDKALIFEKSNVRDLKEKLQKSCDETSMVEKMKKQAADFICNKYNWDEVVERTLELYRGN